MLSGGLIYPTIKNNEKFPKAVCGMAGWDTKKIYLFSENIHKAVQTLQSKSITKSQTIILDGVNMAWVNILFFHCIIDAKPSTFIYSTYTHEGNE